MTSQLVKMMSNESLRIHYIPSNERERRDSKRWVLGKTTSFMALLWCASHFMQDRIVQRLQFHNLLHRPREDLITRNLRMRDHGKKRTISKLWTL